MGSADVLDIGDHWHVWRLRGDGAKCSACNIWIGQEEIERRLHEGDRLRDLLRALTMKSQLAE